MSLDKSWKTFMEEENYVDTYQQGYLHGASDFQQKAIEALENEANISYEVRGISYLGFKLAIDIIKNLKA